MHCVNCGTQNLETTRYCKSCGANLEVLRQALSQNVSSGPLTLIGPRHVGAILALSAVLGLGGLGIVFGCLVALSISIGPTLGNGLFPLLLMLGAVGVTGVCFIVGSLLRMLKAQPSSTASGPTIVQSVIEGRPSSRVLPEFHEPMSSIVESTTSRLPNYAPPHSDGPSRR